MGMLDRVSFQNGIIPLKEMEKFPGKDNSRDSSVSIVGNACGVGLVETRTSLIFQEMRIYFRKYLI